MNPQDSANLRHAEPAVINLLAVAGSLRRDSFNRRVLRAMSVLAPRDVSIHVYDELGSVPLFNEDLELPSAPAGVMQLRSSISLADGVLIATPEYNQSLSGVVKNMVDWLSRGKPEVLAGKPVGIVGATVGPWGTRLAQAALRQTLTACGALIMPAPQVYLRNARELFDAEGNLIEPRARESLTNFVASFDRWIRAQRPPVRSDAA
jgi:chromate reductase